MNPDERGLLASIAAAPDDDTPRLVYADWLDDHGHPIRAEFIRLQCRIAQIETQPRHVVNLHSGLWQRQQEILDGDQSWVEILGPLAGYYQWEPSWFEFHRGFVSVIRLVSLHFLQAAADLAAYLPTPDVEVSEVFGPNLPEFLGSPHLGCVTRIAGYNPLLEFGVIEWPGDEDVLTNAEDRLTRLRALDLEGCGVNDLHIDLMDNFTLPALTDLDLSNNQITDIGVDNLLRTVLPQQLKRLILGGNPIGDQGAIELADRWPRNSPLEQLNLRFTNIGQPGQAALLARFGGVVDLF